jgi:hypothetical protein
LLAKSAVGELCVIIFCVRYSTECEPVLITKISKVWRLLSTAHYASELAKDHRDRVLLLVFARPFDWASPRIKCE